MNRRFLAAGMLLMGLLLIAPAQAAEGVAPQGNRALALGLNNGSLPRADAESAMRTRHSALMGRSHNDVQVEPSLKQRALQSVFTAPPGNYDELIPADQSAQFKFDRRGNAGRDLRRSYINMCTSVSRKLWDEPNGKRIRFDVAGKPGVKFEIPLH